MSQISNASTINTSKQLQRDEINFVIYHNPCTDGFGSASVVYEYFKKKTPNTDPITQITFFPCSHGQTPPTDEQIKGKNILICDFSFSKEILDNMIELSNQFLLIDHHKTTQKDLEEIPEHFKIFDMTHSGASLTWSYMNDHSPNDYVSMPLLIQYIEDNDCWKKNLPYSREYEAWFLEEELDFENFSQYYNNDHFEHSIKTKGSGMLDKDLINVKNALEKVHLMFQKFSDKKTNTHYYLIVAYLNTSILKSRIGNEILKKYPISDIAVVYSISDKSNNTSFSLRSTDTQFDASVIAKILGGGGHRNACGAGVPYPTNVLPAARTYDSAIINRLQNIYYKIFTGLIGIGIGIVYCQSDSNTETIGKYLLQTKYTDQQNYPVLECVAISALGPVPKIAAVWYFDTLKNQTIFKITFHESIDNKQKEFITKLFKIDSNNEVSVEGFHTLILVNN